MLRHLGIERLARAALRMKSNMRAHVIQAEAVAAAATDGR